MGAGENPDPEQTEKRQSGASRCPACRGEVDPAATLCRHCGSNIVDASRDLPRHGGVCPFCREAIHEQALICRHCGSPVVGDIAGPAHGGECPLCREAIDPQASICPKCRSTLWQRPANGSARAINDGGGGLSTEDCTWHCYDVCRKYTGKSRAECLRRCAAICRPDTEGVFTRSTVSTNAAESSTGCGCGGNCGGNPTTSRRATVGDEAFPLPEEGDGEPQLRMAVNRSGRQVVSQRCGDGSWQECPLRCFPTSYGLVCVQICSGCYGAGAGGGVFA